MENILVEDRNILSKTEIKVQNGNYFFDKNRDLCQKSKSLPKIEIFAKNRNRCPKSNSGSKIEIIDNIFGQISRKFWLKIKIVVNKYNFGRNFNFNKNLWEVK